MLIGTVLLIIWLVLKYGMEKTAFAGMWIIYAYLIEVGFYIFLVILGGLIRG